MFLSIANFSILKENKPDDYQVIQKYPYKSTKERLYLTLFAFKIQLASRCPLQNYCG